MKKIIFSLFIAFIGVFSASAGVITETADSVAAIEGVTFVDGTAEAQKDADVKFAKVYMMPADKAAVVNSLFAALPDDMVAVDVADGNDMVKMWVEPINDKDADAIILVSSGNQNIVVYLSGNLDDIKNNINVGGN